MRKLLTSWNLAALAGLALLGTAAWASRAAAAAEETPAVTSVFKVEGMTCGGCEASVRMTVKRLGGVRAVEASYEAHRATVTYDEKEVTPQAIVQAIEKLGYTAELLETKRGAGPSEPEGAGNDGSRAPHRGADL